MPKLNKLGLQVNDEHVECVDADTLVTNDNGSGFFTLLISLPEDVHVTITNIKLV
jgi:hypothetical protein